MDTSFKTIYSIVCNEYPLDEVFYKLVKITRPVSPVDMEGIVGLIFDSFRTVYSPDENAEKGKASLADQAIDYKQDYSVIWDTLKAHRRVDLNTDDISWIEFQHLLHGVLLDGVGSLCKVLEFRSYEKPPEGKNAAKQIEQRQHMHRVKMKSMYRIRKTEQQQRAELGNTLHSIMDFMKGKKRPSC